MLGWLHKLPAQTWTVDGTEKVALSHISANQLLRGKDSTSVRELFQLWQERAYRKSYLEASVETFLWNEGIWKAELHLGPRYFLESLKIDRIPPRWLQRSQLEEYPRKPVPLNWSLLENSLEEGLLIAQNEGFPFAVLTQTNIEIREDEANRYLSVGYIFESGPEIRVDSLRFRGTKKEPDEFVRGIVRIQPGELYNQSRVDAIPSLLNNTVYYQNVAQATVEYTGDGKAIITVPVEQKKSNRFDILAGLLPTTPGSERNFQFTVNADVTLVSPFGQGEIIGIEFQKLPGTSQLVDVFTRLPYLFRTPLQAEGTLRIQKQDELFQNLNYSAGLLYNLSPFLQATFTYQGNDTRLLQTALEDTAKITPAQLDGSRILGGVGLKYEQLDYRNNPSRGLEGHVLLSVGAREVRENVVLQELKPEWYDQVPANQRVLELRSLVKGYLPFGQRQVLHLAQDSYWLGMTQYLRNDQRQVGGVYSLRGFNENQYFADLFLKLTVEYRFRLERNSFIFAFTDLAYLEDQIDQINRRALGTGIGMQYGTQVGILSIVYAIGVSEDQAFQPSRGRIHLGLVNEF